jgi:hypothetical protein
MFSDIASNETQSCATRTPEICIPIINGVGGAGITRKTRIKMTGSAKKTPTKTMKIRRTQEIRLSLPRLPLRFQSACLRRVNPVDLEIFGSNAFRAN